MSKRYLGFIDRMLVGRMTPDAPGGEKYMDWDKAEKICLEHSNSVVYAGLREDWGYTSGVIFKKGKWCAGGILYGRSRWATPILDIDGEEIECWTHKPNNGTGVPSWWGRGAELESGYDWDLDEEDET